MPIKSISKNLLEACCVSKVSYSKRYELKEGFKVTKADEEEEG